MRERERERESTILQHTIYTQYKTSFFHTRSFVPLLLFTSYRELKRLSTVTLSPIYAHFSETLAGLPTIRALRASRRFMAENEERLTVNQRANFGSEPTYITSYNRVNVHQRFIKIYGKLPQCFLGHTYMLVL